MLINFHSSFQYMRPVSPPSQADKFKSFVTYLAIGILFGCAAYWIYKQFWNQRRIQQQSPHDQPKNISPLFIKALSPIEKREEEAIKEESPQPIEVQKIEKVAIPAADRDPLPQKELLPLLPKKESGDNGPVASKIPPKTLPKTRKKANPQAPKKPEATLKDKVLPQPAIKPKLDLKEDIPKEALKDFDEKDKKTVPVIHSSQLHHLNEPEPDFDFDEGMDDLPIDDALTIEENIEKDLVQYLRQERGKYSYGGMFYRYEGVYAALKDLQNKSKHDYVNFCNASFAEHFETKREAAYHWDIYISIDPDQRTLAWQILSDEIENTSLSIRGAIYSSEKCLPGKEILLQFLIHDYPKKTELLQFLTLLAQHLSQESVLIDNRPFRDEPVLGIIPCKGVPSYFSYGTDTFTVVDDQVWDVLLADRQQIDKIIEGKVVKLEDGQAMIKASYYRTLGAARVNPLAIQNPFEGLEIVSLTL